MRDKHKSRWLQSCRLGLSAMALGQLIVSPVLAAEGPGEHETGSPIKHVIVIIGENRSFDHVFATYVPKRPEEKVFNLLSQGIIKLDKNNNALPGPNFEKAHQLAAKDVGTTDAFLLSPPKQAFPNDQLPAPLVGGPKVSFIPTNAAARRSPAASRAWLWPSCRKTDWIRTTISSS
jgi:phospholipase C